MYGLTTLELLLRTALLSGCVKCSLVPLSSRPLLRADNSADKSLPSSDSSPASSRLYPIHTDTNLQTDDYDKANETEERRNQTAEEKLLARLFLMYSSDARAGLDSLSTVKVNVEYTLLRIQKLNERTQVLTTAGLVITDWVDERLVWDPSDYENLTEIVMPPTMIWLPELTIMNGADNMVHDFTRMGVLLSYTGDIHWEPGGIFATSCDLDITYFPFDAQNCSVIVGAWAYYTQRMNITHTGNKMALHEYSINGEWEITDTEVTWGETSIPGTGDISYSYVSSKLSMKRRLPYYFVNVMLPCFMLSTLVLVTFAIPPEAGEKISCGISVLLAFTVFLLYVSECVPKTSLQMPVLAVYLMSTMMLSAVSLTLSTFVLKVHFSKKEQHVPRWVQIVILTLLAGVLCMRRSKLIKNKIVSPPRPKRPQNNHGHIDDHAHDVLRNRNTPRRDLASSHSRRNSPGYDNVPTQSDDDDSHDTLSQEQVHDIYNNVPYIYHVHDWRDVSRVLDRLFFFMVLIAMIVSSAITLFAPYVSVS